MRYTKRKLLVSFIVAFAVLSFAGLVFSQITYSFFWHKEVPFNLSTYNTYVKFDEDIYIGSFIFYQGTRLDFTNIFFDVDNVASFDVGTNGCNMTVEELSTVLLEYSVTGAGNQTVNLMNKSPTSVIIDGSTGFNGVDYTLSGRTITVLSATSSVVISYSSARVLAVFDNIYVAIGLLAVLPLVIVGGILMYAIKNEVDSSTVTLLVIALVVFAILIGVLLIVLHGLEVSF